MKNSNSKDGASLLNIKSFNKLDILSKNRIGDEKKNYIDNQINNKKDSISINNQGQNIGSDSILKKRNSEIIVSNTDINKIDGLINNKVKKGKIQQRYSLNIPNYSININGNKSEAILHEDKSFDEGEKKLPQTTQNLDKIKLQNNQMKKDVLQTNSLI